MRNVVLLTCVLVSSSSAACKPHAAPTADASAASAAPVTSATPPAPTAAAPVPVPNWMKNVPAKPVRAKVGDTVWAVVGDGSPSDLDVGLLGPYKVDAINGNTASVSGKQGKHDVPGFFVLPTGDATKLKVGDAAVVAFGGGWGFGRVTKNDKGKITARVYLSDKTAKDESVDLATAVPSGTTAPFSDVYYEKYPGKPNYKGMVIAEDGGTSWVIDHDGSILNETKAKLQPLKWAFKDRKVGDKVIIFAGMGAADATIAKVLDPKAFFDVAFDGITTYATYDQLTDKL